MTYANRICHLLGGGTPHLYPEARQRGDDCQPSEPEQRGLAMARVHQVVDKAARNQPRRVRGLPSIPALRSPVRKVSQAFLGSSSLWISGPAAETTHPRRGVSPVPVGWELKTRLRGRP